MILNHSILKVISSFTQKKIQISALTIFWLYIKLLWFHRSNGTYFKDNMTSFLIRIIFLYIFFQFTLIGPLRSNTLDLMKKCFRPYKIIFLITPNIFGLTRQSVNIVCILTWLLYMWKDLIVVPTVIAWSKLFQLLPLRPYRGRQIY